MGVLTPGGLLGGAGHLTPAGLLGSAAMVVGSDLELENQV